MKKLLAITLIGFTAVTAAAASNLRMPVLAPANDGIDEALVTAKIDARQNQLMRALLTARLAAHAQASR